MPFIITSCNLCSFNVAYTRHLYKKNQCYLQYCVGGRLAHYVHRVAAVEKLLQAVERICTALHSEVGDQGGRVGSVQEYTVCEG
jgi:hypothetical protein